MAAFIATASGAQASTTPTISASPASATVGQSVTFTATFTSSCLTGVSHYFTVDGKTYRNPLSRNGQTFTEKLTIASLAGGKHTIGYFWYVGTSTTCKGSATISYTVSAAPTPTPSPPPSPSPCPSPSPSASPTPLQLTSSTSGGSSGALGYLGGALIVVTIIAGVALAVFGRR